MEKRKIIELRTKVDCAALLDRASFAVDAKESTRKAVKYRHADGQIVIVIHAGQGWFDPLSDAKGDVFSLAMHLGAADFPAALQEVGELVGYTPTEASWQPPVRAANLPAISTRWSARRKPWRGSATWTYLATTRFLPDTVIRVAVAADLLREGPYGSMWAKHVDDAGRIRGWEERGPDWRGFSTDGDKTLLRFGNGTRLCVTESAIDAFSLAALEEIRRDTSYFSTGGGWSPATTDVLKLLTQQPGAVLVAATDANIQGDVYAERLREIAIASGCGYERSRPSRDDWNDVLAARHVASKSLPMT